MKFDTKKTVFLIDGSSLLYRGYYGMQPLNTSKGVPVQAVYAFCRMIKRLVDKFKPEYLAIVWDSRGKTKRHELYAEYKATRQAAPSDLHRQKEYVVKFADLVGIQQVMQEGVEADDLMFSIAQECVKRREKAVLVSSDKDMGQALSDAIFMYDPLKDIVYDSVNFAHRMGFPVEKFSFYVALVGDPSDNIPGVRGVGKKTALDLVNSFESLEDLYKQLDTVKSSRARTALHEHKQEAFLSQDLFLFHYYKTGLTKEDCAFNMSNWKKALPLFQELEFTSLLKDAGETKIEQQATVQEIVNTLKKRDYRLITTREQLGELCSLLKKAKQFAFDTETTGLHPMEDDLVGVSFCVQEGQAFYVPCGHTTGEEQVSLEDLVAELAPLFAYKTIKKYAHNGKFDQLVLSNQGIDIQGPLFDTCIAAGLATRERWPSAALERLSLYYFDEPMLTFKQIVNDQGYKNFAQVPINDALYYAANDAHQTWRLVSVLQVELKAQNMETLFDAIEMPLVPILCEMEKRGIFLDVKELQHVDKIITHGLEVIQHDIKTLTGNSINLNSPRQVGKLLFETLGLVPENHKSKEGTYSTGHEILAELAKEHPVPGLILKYRELAKLKSTYLDALPLYINKKTGRIHTTFSQTRVATGRLSSSDPNMQNIPTTTYGIAIRGAFKPQEGNVFISADYSQMELRVLAHITQDEHLIKAFNHGHDIHAETAARLFDEPLSKVTHDERQMGKRVNFSIIYGLTPYGLSKDMDIPYKDAKRYIEKYFSQYPGVAAWIDRVITFVKKNGYVTTHWGRRRDIPGIHEKNKHLYEEACRIAINTVAQGTSAEIVKMGMINVHKAFIDHKLDARIVLQIHDELLITVSERHQEKAESLIVSTLDSVVDWSVPLLVTTRTGFDWKQVSK